VRYCIVKQITKILAVVFAVNRCVVAYLCVSGYFPSQPVQEFAQETVVTGIVKGVLPVQTEYFADMQLFLLRTVRDKFCGNNELFLLRINTHTPHTHTDTHTPHTYTC